jgi:hypothetical protein
MVIMKIDFLFRGWSPSPLIEIFGLSILRVMADDASYMAFLQRANNPPSAPSSSTQTTASSIDEPNSSKHPFLPLLNNRLANLSSKTFVTETDTDFYATFISSSTLPSWSDSPSELPSAQDLESQVEGGREGTILSEKEWDSRGEYAAIIKSVKEITKRKEVAIYIVQGRGGRFVVFILAKMEDGLVGVKAKGVAT